MTQDKRPGGFTHERSYQGNTDTWLTPPEILHRLGDFDLDPCAAPSPRPWPTARVMYEEKDDGLSKTWAGRVWLNPPYGPALRFWLEKLAKHGNGIALVFARTETEAFQQWVFPFAHLLLFLDKRLNFYTSDGVKSSSNAGSPSVLVAYGDLNATILYESGLSGALVSPLKGPSGQNEHVAH